MEPKTAFVISQVGASDSTTRKRADEIYNHVLTPIFSEFTIKGYRADKDPAPGSITDKLIRELVRADLVVVDLTGMNPNVFYELGVAHSFDRRVIAISDTTDGLPFDNKDQRTIALGKYPESGLSVTQAEAAKDSIREAVRAALDESYTPVSPVKGAAGVATLDSLAEEDPVASELAQMRDQLEFIGEYMRRAFTRRPRIQSLDAARLARAVAEDLAAHPSQLIEPTSYAEYPLSDNQIDWLNHIRDVQRARIERIRRSRETNRESSEAADRLSTSPRALPRQRVPLESSPRKSLRNATQKRSSDQDGISRTAINPD